MWTPASSSVCLLNHLKSVKCDLYKDYCHLSLRDVLTKCWSFIFQNSKLVVCYFGNLVQRLAFIYILINIKIPFQFHAFIYLNFAINSKNHYWNLISQTFWGFQGTIFNFIYVYDFFILWLYIFRFEYCTH